MKFSKTAVLVHIIIIVIIIPTIDAVIVISVPRSRSFPGERCGRGRRRSGRRRTAAQRDRHTVFCCVVKFQNLGLGLKVRSCV